ncbi:hypothetical protein HW44_01755 [Nitrosococcus oceani]|nr:hypothetical protein HW44_01755 [Nitrosococcus oceani]
MGSVAAIGADAKSAPGYSARVLGSDQVVELTSLRGQVVLLNTWATWCSPCRKELPDFEAIRRRYEPRGLAAIGVNIDEDPADGPVQRYLKSVDVTSTNWHDPLNHFAKRFRVLGVPATFLLDRQGRILHRWDGPVDPGAPENLEMIEAVLHDDGKNSEIPGSGVPSGRGLAE